MKNRPNTNKRRSAIDPAAVVLADADPLVAKPMIASPPVARMRLSVQRRRPRGPLRSRCGTALRVRIQLHELSRHAVGPTESILQRVLPSPAGSTQIDHIVFLDQLSRRSIDLVDIGQPSFCDGPSELGFSIGSQAAHG